MRLLAVIAIVIYDVFVWGLVTLKFWQWFMLPTFPSLPVLTFIQAVGLMMFISLFKNHSPQLLKDENVDQPLSIIMALIGPWFLLIVGFFVQFILR